MVEKPTPMVEGTSVLLAFTTTTLEYLSPAIRVKKLNVYEK